jgi:hypothetical protein
LFGGYSCPNAYCAGNHSGPELTLHWLHAKNQTNFEIAGTQIDELQGWDYLWVYFEPAKVPAAAGGAQPLIADVPVQIEIAQLYKRTDFQEMGIFDV